MEYKYLIVFAFHKNNQAFIKEANYIGKEKLTLDSLASIKQELAEQIYPDGDITLINIISFNE